MEMGQEIQRRLIHLGMSQKDLCELTEIEPYVMSRYLKGDMSIVQSNRLTKKIIPVLHRQEKELVKKMVAK